MIKIILNGCNGKMGKVISNLAKDSTDVTIVAGVDRKVSPNDYPVFSSIEDCDIPSDVILDFSRPDSLSSLIKYAKEKKLGLVLCTTGYSDDQIKEIEAASHEIPLFRSANMSIGINVINGILKNISSYLYKNFDIEVVEAHHNQKVDSPSGTALMLADSIKESIDDDIEFVNGRNGIKKRSKNEIGIHSIRGGSIVGEHSIIFAGQGETIEIKHTAISREVFAVGALKACEFMYKKEAGMYSMDDVISNNN
ncbi:4-hydroxy-tetrahydrodipicolinate reductase [Clostridium sp. cel8]|jgi:4-hydroxy-tetrahydrodipicolinate reductase|uniref:4-hydroxy-tetrahydrodipicolinate reductase n=1 Tax=unclassified Clostridium TaxID=2614128 RepID=UPI0015F5215A|nr:4-hydroxy-tetrahydrodipicolinate reductase [Clostridium sp. cel8]MBA5851216.1 4-hydroxy-tetrahydrodipicolinate reductase [Clostridium sp. cel8]